MQSAPSSAHHVQGRSPDSKACPRPSMDTTNGTALGTGWRGGECIAHCCGPAAAATDQPPPRRPLHPSAPSARRAAISDSARPAPQRCRTYHAPRCSHTVPQRRSRVSDGRSARLNMRRGLLNSVFAATFHQRTTNNKPGCMRAPARQLPSYRRAVRKAGTQGRRSARQDRRLRTTEVDGSACAGLRLFRVDGCHASESRCRESHVAAAGTLTGTASVRRSAASASPRAGSAACLADAGWRLSN